MLIYTEDFLLNTIKFRSKRGSSKFFFLYLHSSKRTCSPSMHWLFRFLVLFNTIDVVRFCQLFHEPMVKELIHILIDQLFFYALPRLESSSLLPIRDGYTAPPDPAAPSSVVEGRWLQY